ncbi:hypothetical protein D521_1245 [beta proteobacterium CB]|nr:hypothetical protein D521_1245 [beta proteobacterium CB]
MNRLMKLTTQSIANPVKSHPRNFLTLFGGSGKTREQV